MRFDLPQNGGEPSHTVMLVDDNPADARLVEEMVREVWADEWEVLHVESLADACEQLARSSLGCVLLDLLLPDSEGLDGVSRVREVAPDVPIIVLTGHDDEDLAVRAVRSGAQDYLVKDHADGYLIARSIRYAIERKRVESRLVELSLRDPLTGLPNRLLLIDRLRLALLRMQRHSRSVAVLFVDLDRFKNVNDRFGHQGGDETLVQVAGRLEGALRPSDTVARFGGDEFVVLCEGIAGERDALAVAERIQEALHEPLLVEGIETPLRASIGIALATGPEDRAETLIHEADMAMYRAKINGAGP